MQYTIEEKYIKHANEIMIIMENKTNLNETFSKKEEKKISDKDIETIAEKLLSSSRPVL